MLKATGWLFALFSLTASACWAQAPATQARIETAPVELVAPDRYSITEVLEPVRKVALIAPQDGAIRGLEAHLGQTVREGVELAQLDRSEALARLKIATAVVHAKQAQLTSRSADQAVARYEVEEAEAQAELAQLLLDRCTLRAPFAGMVVAVPTTIGQFVLKGTVIAELADVSSLKAKQPVDRRKAAVGGKLILEIEDRTLEGTIQAVIPLPEDYFVLRELATPYAMAWVSAPNFKGDLVPGLRVRSVGVPRGPVAVVAKVALKPDDHDPSGRVVQVIRNEYVVNVPVQVLGEIGPERVQITGALRQPDSLVVASSSPLLSGTLVRFETGPGKVEGVAPNPRMGGSSALLGGGGESSARGAVISGGGSPPPGSVTPATPARRRPGTQPRGGSSAPF